MASRPLHAVLLPQRSAGSRLPELLAAAIDGTGPAILPLDPALPAARRDALLAAFAPATIEAGPGPGQVPLPGPGTPVSDDVAVVLATSGSTGRPKGAELTAAALLASARASLARLGAAPGERWLCGLPTHHVSGLGVLVRSLAAGSDPVIAGRLDAEVVSAAIRSGCRFASLVPTQLRSLLNAGAPLAQFRALLLGGAAIPPGMLDEAAAAGARVVTSYGMTETCGGCVYDGVPLDGVTVGSAADGRIRISGPVLFSGYRLAPGLTAAALDGGWFTTCDLGGPGPDGRLVIRGRADDVINSGGEKVVAGEVEQVLRECALVRDAAVVGTPDPYWGERVTALIVPADPADPPGLELIRTHVAARLPRHAAPRELLVLPGLPLLASGKPDRQRLLEMALAARPSGPAS